MLSLAKAAKDYYLRKLEEISPREDYYLRDGTATGTWRGSGAEELGLEGPVSAEGLVRLFDGEHPGTGDQLGRRLRKDGVAAWDLTFSADKSVSLLWALGDEETRRQVLEALEKAVEAPTRAFPRPLARLKRRVVTATAALFFVLSAGTGVAVAANGAAPGDFLYGLDRALEAVGIGGEPTERLQEAQQLVADGQVGRGLEHAAEVMAASAKATPSNNGDIANEALRSAAERMRALTSHDPDATTTAVTDLLSYLAGNIEQVDGRQVADLASLIGHPPSSSPDTLPGLPETLPAPGRP